MVHRRLQTVAMSIETPSRALEVSAVSSGARWSYPSGFTCQIPLQLSVYTRRPAFLRTVRRNRQRRLMWTSMLMFEGGLFSLVAPQHPTRERRAFPRISSVIPAVLMACGSRDRDRTSHQRPGEYCRGKNICFHRTNPRLRQMVVLRAKPLVVNQKIVWSKLASTVGRGLFASESIRVSSHRSVAGHSGHTGDIQDRSWRFSSRVRYTARLWGGAGVFQRAVNRSP